MIGLLAGFIAGYLVHDAVAVRQPPRLPAGAAIAAAGPSAAAPGSPGGSMPASPPGDPMAPMAEIQRLREHVEQNPDDADAILLLANLNFDIRNWERARELYSRHLELRPGNPDILTDLGVAYRELGQHQKALELFDQAQRLQPNHWQSLYNQIVVHAFDLEDYPAADRLLAELRRLQPDNPSVGELATEIARRRAAG
jgi:tetratricopeptide (TPR) repeat protein